MTTDETLDLIYHRDMIKFISEKMIDLSAELDYQIEEIDKDLLKRKNESEEKNDI